MQYSTIFLSNEKIIFSVTYRTGIVKIGSHQENTLNLDF